MPIESEKENVEYLLDLWTNRFDRHWREAWEGGYNRFRFRVGSNNVREWFIEEELKFESPFGGRLRFLYFHTRLIHDSSDQQAHDVLEIEGRVRDKLYLSLLVEPAFEKAENTLGLALQRRTAVNRYAQVFVEFPHLVRNFAERHGDTGGKILAVFTDQPFRVGFDVRELLNQHVWLRATGNLIPDFRGALEDGTTGEILAGENGYAEAVEGWVEYFEESMRGRNGVRATGITFGHKKTVKGGPTTGSQPSSPDLIQSADRGATAGPRAIPAIVDRDFYLITEPDSISGWEQNYDHVGPYTWLPLSERSVLKSSFMYVDRTLKRYDRSGRRTDVTNSAVVAGFGLLRQIGRGGTYVEAGIAAEYRHRLEKKSGGGLPDERREDDIHDSRVYLVYEHRFEGAKSIRLIETIDLDKEDWGAFSIHDHAFVQLLFEF